MMVVVVWDRSRAAEAEDIRALQSRAGAEHDGGVVLPGALS